ncbi:unnamed protein product, partial [Prorocentrum cordatum]
EVAGTVTCVGRGCALVDFGAACEGKLPLARRDAWKLQVGDQVEGLLVERVGPDREVELALTYELADEPYLELQEDFCGHPEVRGRPWGSGWCSPGWDDEASNSWYEVRPGGSAWAWRHSDDW